MVMGSKDPVDWWDTPFLMSTVKISSDVVHSQADTWGIVEVFLIL